MCALQETGTLGFKILQLQENVADRGESQNVADRWQTLKFEQVKERAAAACLLPNAPQSRVASRPRGAAYYRGPYWSSRSEENTRSVMHVPTRIGMITRSLVGLCSWAPVGQGQVPAVTLASSPNRRTMTSRVGPALCRRKFSAKSS